jgi:hypothetical protein
MSEEQKNRILLRRAKFVAAAIAASAISADACGGTTVPGDDGGSDSAVDGTPQACLKMVVDSGPQPCLTPIQDSGTNE